MARGGSSNTADHNVGDSVLMVNGRCIGDEVCFRGRFGCSRGRRLFVGNYACHRISLFYKGDVIDSDLLVILLEDDDVAGHLEHLEDLDDGDLAQAFFCPLFQLRATCEKPET